MPGKRRLKTIIYFIPLLLTCFYSDAQSVKRLYIANDDHTDYMWTANEARYDTAFVQMLDYYLDQADANRNNIPDFQSRFNCDGSYWIRAYEKYRSPQQFQRLIDNIRSGHISSPLNFLVSTYGGQPAEAVLRGMYHAGKLERQYNIRFSMAVCMENQTLPLGLSSLWAGAGAKYSWRGVCGCASRISNQSLSQRRNQLYRYTGADDRSVIMKWYNRVIFNGRTLGGYAECRREKKPSDPTGEMGLVIKDLYNMCDTTHAHSRYPYNVAGAFGYGWDDIDNFNAPAFVNAAKLYSTKNTKVRVSSEEDFFKDVEKNYPELPSESVSYGNEWDTYCASMNETTARVRRSTEKLRSAEAVASVVALKENNFGSHLTPLRNQAWEALGSYWEHDWTADGPVSQRARADWQIKIQQQISNYTDTLYNLSVKTLGNHIKRSVNPRFYVFNPLSFSRNDIADLLYEGTGQVKIIDLETGKEVPMQVIQKSGGRYLRISAGNIPPVGYKVFEIRNGIPAILPPAASVSGEYISNGRFRIRLSASGVITEIYDSLSRRQIVKAVNGKYINDLGARDVNDGDKLVIENEGAVSVTLKAFSTNPLPHTSRITVFANSPRIEIEDSILANYRNVQTWAFSFNLKGQTTHHEELGAILSVKKETRGGSYAAQNARYDWQTFNHFADMSEAAYGVTLSNMDCSFFRLGQSTPDSLWEESSQLNALAGGQVDRYTENPSGWKDTVRMGIYNQDGQTGFKYQFALTTHASAFDPLQAMKFSLEHQNPLLTGMVTGSESTEALNSYSLLKISDPSVLLWSIKPAEEGIGKGLITRFWNFKNSASNPVITLADPISEAWQTSHIETDEQQLHPVKGAVTVKFAKNQINTFRLIPGKGIKQ